MIITRQQQRVLEALACFRYLTIPQMLKLGLSSHADSLRSQTLKRLTDTHYKAVKSHDFGWIPQHGRLAKIYYLTHTGATLLAEALQLDINDIEYPKGGVQFSSDYQHRVNYINFHIELRRWAELNNKALAFVESYFDKTGRQQKGHVSSISKTRVQLNGKAFIPDGIVKYQDHHKSRLVAIEIHNGTHSKRITEQLLAHIEALEHGLFSEKYQHSTANFVWSVHENQSTLTSVKKRLSTVFQDPRFKLFQPLFLFNSQAQAQEDFAQGWTLADGRKTALFP